MPTTEGRPFPVQVVIMTTLPVIDFEGEVAAHKALLKADIKMLCYKAKREMPRIGTTRYPTPWDLWHKQIDAKLTELQAIG
jgi:hypothetical protein